MFNIFYFVNFPDIDSKSADSYYDIRQIKFPIENYVLCHATGLVIKSTDREKCKTINFFTKPIVVDEKELYKINSDILNFLDKNIGRQRLVNPRQFEIIEGSVVRSKANALLKAGIVLAIEGDMLKVRFPEGKKMFGKEIISCHKSSVRVVTHIEEVKANGHKKNNR